MILICFGTRPEWLKVKPLVAKLNCKLLFTGQHTDLLKDVPFDFKLTLSSENYKERLNFVIGECLREFPNTEEFSHVLVQGDTATAFGCALAAFNQGTKVIHLEAGLRTRDLNNPFPEEGYRQMISRISSINLCPTDLARYNLESEGINGSYVVGNTVLDNLLPYKDKCKYGNKVLVTLHRRENHGNMAEWFQEISNLASEYPLLEFVLPLHPNPEVIRHKDLLKNVNVIAPMEHESLLNLLSECLLCITDSGGIQEEASFLNKKCIVCRLVTERSEGLETGHIILCKSPDLLTQCFYNIINDYEIQSECPFGDGHSSQKIKELLNEF